MKKRSKKRWILVSAALFIICIAILLCSLLMGDKTYYSSNHTEERSMYLVCSVQTFEEPFFPEYYSITSEHQIKIIFNNEKPNKISYTYSGTYASSELAKQVASDFRAKYNIFLNKLGVDIASFDPIFNTIDNKTTVNLFANGSNLNPATAPLFLLKPDEAMNFHNYSSNEIMDVYKTKGMACILYE